MPRFVMVHDVIDLDDPNSGSLPVWVNTDAVTKITPHRGNCLVYMIDVRALSLRMTAEEAVKLFS